MSLILHLIGTDQDPVLGIKATRFSVCATTAVNIMAMQVASELLDIIAEESDDGTYVDFSESRALKKWRSWVCLTVLEKIIALILASLAISRFVSNVSRNAKLLDALSRHLAGQNRVHVAKLRPRVVSWNVTCVFAI